jgi:hypothetical protein
VSRTEAEVTGAGANSPMGNIPNRFTAHVSNN